MFEPVYFVNRHSGSANYHAHSRFCSGADLLGRQKGLCLKLHILLPVHLITCLIVLLVYIIIQVLLPDNNTAFQVLNSSVLEPLFWCR